MYSLLSDEDQKINNYKKGDTEGFVNFGLSIEGILCSVLMVASLMQLQQIMLE